MGDFWRNLFYFILTLPFGLKPLPRLLVTHEAVNHAVPLV